MLEKYKNIYIYEYVGDIEALLQFLASYTLFFYKNNFIRTTSLNFAKNLEQLRTTRLKLRPKEQDTKRKKKEKEKKKKKKKKKENEKEKKKQEKKS